MPYPDVMKLTRMLTDKERAARDFAHACWHRFIEQLSEADQNRIMGSDLQKFLNAVYDEYLENTPKN